MPLKDESKRQKMANVQALIAKICEKYLEEKSKGTVAMPSRESDIDLRSLLLEAHRNISALTRTITVLTEERKKPQIADVAHESYTGLTAKRSHAASHSRAGNG